MQADAKEPIHTECNQCSIELPIRVTKETGALRVRCRYCGSLYRAVILEDCSETIQSNIEVVEDSELIDPELNLEAP